MYWQMSEMDRLVMGLMLVLLAIFFLPGALFMGVFLFSLEIFKNRKPLVYLIFSGLVAVDAIFLVEQGLTAVAVKYFQELWNLYAALYKQKIPAGMDWLLLVQSGLPVGFGAGLLYRLYKISMPDWVKRSIEKSKGKGFNEKLLQKISEEHHPENGVLLGVSNEGKRAIVTDAELNGHCLLLGATGAGKTTTLLNFVESAAQRGLPAIIVDGKGDEEFVNKVGHLAGKYGRKFYFFSMSAINESKHYNPLRHGNYTELKDKLISMTEWTEPHYKMQAERYLQTAVRALMLAGVEVDLVSVAEEISPKRLEALAKKLPEEVRQKVFNTIDEAGNTVNGLLNRLAVFSESEIGELFVDTDDERTIDLLKALNENAIVLFSLNSLMFAEYSRLLGRLIVIDLKATAARLLGQDKKIYCIFDEFGVFTGPQVTDLINKSRAAGFHVILSTQELADLRSGGSGELMEQVLGNTNVKIIHRQDVPSSAELLASLIGTRDDIMVTRQVNETGATGMGTIKEEKSFMVHPDEIKRLGIGEVFVVKKFPVFSVSCVCIRKTQI